MPSFFSWQVETVLFFLAEKEKNGFKKAFLSVQRKPEKAGGQYPQGVCRIRKVPSSLTAAQSRPPLQGAAEDMRLQRCTATAPRPSSVCFADTFPGGEGIPLRRGFGRTGRGAIFCVSVRGRRLWVAFLFSEIFQTGLKTGKNMLY